MDNEAVSVLIANLLRGPNVPYPMLQPADLAKFQADVLTILNDNTPPPETP